MMVAMNKKTMVEWDVDGIMVVDETVVGDVDLVPGADRGQYDIVASETNAKEAEEVG
jgi:hypothetical protein